MNEKGSTAPLLDLAMSSLHIIDSYRIFGDGNRFSTIAVPEDTITKSVTEIAFEF